MGPLHRSTDLPANLCISDDYLQGSDRGDECDLQGKEKDGSSGELPNPRISCSASALTNECTLQVGLWTVLSANACQGHAITIATAEARLKPADRCTSN